MLAVEKRAKFDESVVDYEYRTHAPFTSTTFRANDEVRIAIQQQDGFTLPCESLLRVAGTLTKEDGTPNTNLHYENNSLAFIFEEIRYEIGGTVVDRVRNLGTTSTLHNLVSLTPGEESRYENAMWFGYGKTKANASKFNGYMPMKMLMGFFEDYKQIIMNQKQELVLIVASNMKNALYKEGATAADTFKMSIDTIEWRVPHVKVADEVKLPLLRMLEQDRLLEMPFRSWALHEYPVLPTSERQSWTIKTSSQLEKPRYVIVAFQTARKDDLSKHASVFDKCNIKEIKLFLNSQQYPYDNFRGDFALMYEHYARFQNSYYGKLSQPIMGASNYFNNPIFVIDCSKQDEALKTGPVDVRLELEAGSAFPENTAAYCLIVHDSLVEYSPLTGSVNRVH